MRDTFTSTATELDDAAWIRRCTIHEAGCMTLVRDTALDRVAAGFGAVREEERTFDFEEFCEESFACADSYPMVALRTMGEWTLVVEDAGYQGSRPEVLRRVARNAPAVSVFWDAARQATFTYAADSAVRTAFEPTLPEVRQGCAPDELEQLRSDLPWEDADPVLPMLVLAGRVTGVAPEPAWLGGQWRTFPVAGWPADQHASDEPAWEVTGLPANLVRELRGSGAHVHRRVAVGVARHVLERTGCLAQPELRCVVEELRTGAVDGDRLAELVRQWHWHGLHHRIVSPEREQCRAVWTLWRASDAAPTSAVVRTVAEARQVRSVPPAELAELVTRLLRVA